MKKILVVIFLFFLSLAIFSEVISFEHANIIYPEGYKKLAIKVGNKFESIRDFVVDLFSYDPGKVNIYIEPNTVISNGYANFLQNNTIKIYTWPPSDYEYTYLPLDDWYTYLLIHEFTHIVSLKKLRGINKITADLKMPYIPNFGKLSYEAPTVFMESSISTNSGRLNNPNISEELFKSFREKFPNDSLMNDFRYGLVYYNANGDFFQYLIEKYGRESVLNYLQSSMDYSLNWLEIMLIPSFPYVLLTKLPILFEDNFKFYFGNSFKNEVKNWLHTFKSNEKPEGALVYKGQNERIYKVISENNNLYILSSSFGAVSGYFNHSINKLTVISDKGTVKNVYYLSAIDFKVEDGKIFILKRNNNNTEIWNLTENRKLMSGKISSFDVYKGKVIFSTYNDKEDISTINVFNKTYTINGFVRELAFNGDCLYILIGNSLLKLENESFKVIDNVSLKGAFLKKKGNDIYLVSKIDGKMEFVKIGKTLIKISNNLNIVDADLDDKNLYFITYLENGEGMGLYKTEKIFNLPENFLIAQKYDIYNFRYTTLPKIDELKLKLIPSIFAPFLFTTYFLPISPQELGFSGWTIGSLFDFTNTNIDAYLSPYLGDFITYSATNNTFNKTKYNLLGLSYGLIYNSPLNDKSLVSLNLYDIKNSFFTGISSLSIKLFDTTLSYDSKISLILENIGTYFYKYPDFNFNDLISFNLNFSNEKFSLGIGESNEITYESNSLLIHSSVYLGILNILSQKNYIYGNMIFDDEDLNMSIVSVNNVFPFYKQAGVALGYLSYYNFVNHYFANNFLLYLYLGHPKSNFLYLQTGILFADDFLRPFIGFGTSPHNIFEIFF